MSSPNTTAAASSPHRRSLRMSSTSFPADAGHNSSTGSRAIVSPHRSSIASSNGTPNLSNPVSLSSNPAARTTVTAKRLDCVKLLIRHSQSMLNEDPSTFQDAVNFFIDPIYSEIDVTPTVPSLCRVPIINNNTCAALPPVFANSRRGLNIVKDQSRPSCNGDGFDRHSASVPEHALVHTSDLCSKSSRVELASTSVVNEPPSFEVNGQNLSNSKSSEVQRVSSQHGLVHSLSRDEDSTNDRSSANNGCVDREPSEDTPNESSPEDTPNQSSHSDIIFVSSIPSPCTPRKRSSPILQDDDDISLLTAETSHITQSPSPIKKIRATPSPPMLRNVPVLSTIPFISQKGKFILILPHVNIVCNIFMY